MFFFVLLGVEVRGGGVSGNGDADWCVCVGGRAVHINGMTVHDEPHLPHGGRKESGFGRFGGSYGLDEFLTTKTVTFMA